MIRGFTSGVVLLLVLTPLHAQTVEQKKASIAYLKSLQTKDGGFLATKDAKEPSLRATSSALRALKYFGGEVPNPEGCARFVAGCFDSQSGGFKDNPQASGAEIAVTAVGLMAVVELKMPAEKYVEPAVKFLTSKAKSYEEIRIAAAGLEAVKQQPEQTKEWLKEIISKRNEDGSYGKGDATARMTGGSVVIELRLGAKLDNPATILKVLRAGQRRDGGFGTADARGSDLETSYRVMRAFHMLKDHPDAISLRAFVASCRNEDGGYGVTPGTNSSLSGTYYAAIILHWLVKE